MMTTSSNMYLIGGGGGGGCRPRDVKVIKNDIIVGT